MTTSDPTAKIQSAPDSLSLSAELPAAPGAEQNRNVGWQADLDRQLLPEAKRGARALFVAFLILRVALVVTAILSVARVMDQTQTKWWFENRLYALSFLDRSFAETKAAKAKLLDYSLGAPERSLHEAGIKLNAVDGWLGDFRIYLGDDNETNEQLDAAKKLIHGRLVEPMNKAMAEHKVDPTKARYNLGKAIIQGQDDSSVPMLQLHASHSRSLFLGSAHFRKQLAENGLGAILMLLGTYVLLLFGLTRAYARQRKRNADALTASETQVRFLLNNMYDGLLIVDEQGKIETGNQRIVELLGYGGESELVGTAASQIFGDQVSETMAGVKETTFSVVLEGTATSADGSSWPAELSMRSVVTTSGERVLITVRDITQKKQAEQWKREMVAVVSHDLRTPLTSMQGSLDLVKAGALGPLPESLKVHLLNANQNTHKLINTINTLLDLEKLEHSVEPAELAPMTLAAAFNDAVDRLGSEIKEKSITVQSENLQLEVLGESLRLSQLIEQLVSNAIKFSGPGSSVTVSAKSEQHWVELRVSDSGRGIPAEMRELIFQRLEQVLPEDRKLGAGLGLPLCKAIANLHGGAIGVDSEDGKGSCFWVLLRPAPGTAALRGETISAAPMAVRA